MKQPKTLVIFVNVELFSFVFAVALGPSRLRSKYFSAPSVSDLGTSVGRDALQSLESELIFTSGNFYALESALRSSQSALCLLGALEVKDESTLALDKEEAEHVRRKYPGRSLV